MTSFEYIDIVETGRSPSGKTRLYEVRNKKSGDVLGTVKWYGPWRQYTFNPAGQTTFSHGCLDDIRHFIVSYAGRDRKVRV